MKKLLIILVLLPLFAAAQTPKSSLIFSADQGDAFIVFLNGIKQNPGPQTNVEIHDLDQPYYDVRIEFASSSVQAVEKKNVSANDSEDRPAQVTYKVKRDKSGKARLVFYAMLPPRPPKTAALEKVPELMVSADANDLKDPKTSPAETKKTLLTNVSGATVSMPLKDSPVNNNITAKPAVVRPEKASVTEKVNIKPEPKVAPSKDEIKKDNKTGELVSKGRKKVEAIPAAVKDDLPAELKKCNDWPMMKEEFQKIKQQVEQASGESVKLAKAKQLSSSNCLLVSQVAEIAMLFPKEVSKIDFVKHAYFSTIDRPNFERLKKLFTDTAVAKDFETFLAKKS